MAKLKCQAIMSVPRTLDKFGISCDLQSLLARSVTLEAPGKSLSVEGKICLKNFDEQPGSYLEVKSDIG